MRVPAALSGAIGVALFAAAALVIGDRPAFDAPPPEVTAWFGEHRTRAQVQCALIALAAPFLVWFLATVVSLTRAADERARRAALTAFGCGIAYLAVFMVDVAAIAVAALRPDRLADHPELATTLVDIEFMAIAMASPLGAGQLAALAVLALRDRLLWPRWVGVLAVAASALYALRTGALFTTTGPFAADGVLGLYVPAAALAGWTFAASVALARRGPRVGRVAA